MRKHVFSIFRSSSILNINFLHLSCCDAIEKAVARCQSIGIPALPLKDARNQCALAWRCPDLSGWKISHLTMFDEYTMQVGPNYCFLSENFYEDMELIQTQETFANDVENFTKSLLLYDQVLNHILYDYCFSFDF